MTLMVNYFTFHCAHCQADFQLTSGEVGWVDKEGNFGLIFHMTNQPVGNPKGSWKSAPCEQQLCPACGKVIFVIHGEAPKIPNTIQIGSNKGEEFSVILVKNENNPKKCPHCQGTLVDARHLETHQTCPKCKEGTLGLKNHLIL